MGHWIGWGRLLKAFQFWSLLTVLFFFAGSEPGESSVQFSGLCWFSVLKLSIKRNSRSTETTSRFPKYLDFSVDG